MGADPSRIIVSHGGTANTNQVHHRDFPEVRADGESPQAAAKQLVNQLVKALDSAQVGFAREAVQKAIDDAQAFADQGA